DRRDWPDAHDLGGHSDRCHTRDPSERLESARAGVVTGTYQGGGGAVNDPGAVASSLNAAECRSDFCERLVGRRPNVRVIRDLINSLRQQDSSLFVTLEFKLLSAHGHHFSRQEPALLRGESPLEAVLGEAISVL